MTFDQATQPPPPPLSFLCKNVLSHFISSSVPEVIHFAFKLNGVFYHLLEITNILTVKVTRD